MWSHSAFRMHLRLRYHLYLAIISDTGCFVMPGVNVRLCSSLANLSFASSYVPYNYFCFTIYIVSEIIPINDHLSFIIYDQWIILYH